MWRRICWRKSSGCGRTCRGLGVRRLSALALIGVAVFATTGLAGYYLSRPTMETLYSGLDRDDISAIGAALREAGVPFDVNAESTVVLTPAGQAARRADDPGGKRPAAQRRGRERTVR